WRSHESRGLTADASGAEPRARQRANKHSTLAGEVTSLTLAGEVTSLTLAGEVTSLTLAGEVTSPTLAGKVTSLTFAGKPAQKTWAGFVIMEVLKPRNPWLVRAHRSPPSGR
ncbi:hypothetical protein, partial [Nocardia sp. NPDC024068]|uniref:hypothetical protein n=1 Tax=Nocardia sp. NPDC024068 TaxID=3157197 RepID=UPI0033C3F7E1